MAKTPKGPANKNNGSSANLGFEAKLWAAADALRNNMDAAEYKHVVLGLIFLKYISDAFEAKHAELDAQRKQGADPEDPDEYRAVSIFWVPPEARWAYLKSMAPQPTIGQLVDDAMSAIERDNTSLKGVLPKDFARPGLDKQRLGQIINLVSDIAPRRQTVPRTRSAASTNISSRVLPAPRARAAASSIRRPMSSACWSKCWRPTRAASTIHAAAPAACSCRVRNSSRPTRENSATFRSTARSRTTPPGASPR
jgi:hypothetical protein